MNVADIIFCVLHTIEFCTFLPQIVKLVRTKSSQDISLLSQILVLFMNSLWMVYWVLTKVTWYEMLFSSVVMMEVIIQFILIVKYHKPQKKEVLNG